MNTAELKYIISYGQDKKALFVGSSIIVAISAVFAAILGVKALGIPVAITLGFAIKSPRK